MQEAMNKPEHFEMVQGQAVFRPTRKATLQQAAELITSAISFSRQHQIKKLLVILTGLTGFEPPNLAAKYFFFREWASAANGQVCIAFVARPEMIDPEKMGITIGKNVGLHSDVFTSEEEAQSWFKNIGS